MSSAHRTAAVREDAIIAFKLAGNKLSPAGRVDLGKGAAPTDVIFSPDGHRALSVSEVGGSGEETKPRANPKGRRSPSVSEVHGIIRYWGLPD